MAGIKGKGGPEHTRFQPGNKLGGRTKGLLHADQARAAIGKLWHVAQDELQIIVKDPKSTSGEAMVASIMLMAIKQGCASRFSILMDRAIGRARNEDEEPGAGSCEVMQRLMDGGISLDAIVQHLGKRSA